MHNGFSVLRLLSGVAALIIVTNSYAMQPCQAYWPHWQAYVDHFIQWDGRVIEHSQAKRTTSEGQAYALFHALVANDRDQFRRVLSWTERNLASGDLSTNLPAWEWGQKDDGGWGIRDDNAASDADLWLAYTLHEAGRLWKSKEYTALARRLMDTIESEEVVQIPRLGFMLLPGPKGFVEGDSRWKLNPSYLPIQLLRKLAVVCPNGPWADLIQSQFNLLASLSRRHAIADWVVFNSEKGRVVDEIAPNLGSYDAVRVYLWAGMLAESDPLRSQLLAMLRKVLNGCHSRRWPPERIDALTGVSQGSGPVGFKAALLPYLKATGTTACLNKQQTLIEKQWRANLLSKSPRYYDQNLALFGLGWMDGRFQFDGNGDLHVCWAMKCQK